MAQYRVRGFTHWVQVSDVWMPYPLTLTRPNGLEFTHIDSLPNVHTPNILIFEAILPNDATLTAMQAEAANIIDVTVRNLDTGAWVKDGAAVLTPAQRTTFQNWLLGKGFLASELKLVGQDIIIAGVTRNQALKGVWQLLHNRENINVTPPENGN